MSPPPAPLPAPSSSRARPLRPSSACGLLLFAALATAACGDPNSAPALERIADVSVEVGATLRLPLRARDADGDRIRFTVSGLPGDVEVAALGRDEALLVWSPLITNTQPGGRRYDVDVSAADGEGGVSRQRFGVSVFPAFGTPSFVVPAGAVINLANESAFSMRIEVKDDDSTDVDILMREFPSGARLAPDGRKAAWFSWTPNEAQRQIGVHRAIFVADDGTTSVEHILTLILLNTEEQSGCEGTPPSVDHLPPADRFDATGIPIEVRADDQESKVQNVIVQWTTADVSEDGSPRLNTLQLQRSGDDGPWTGQISPPGVNPAGVLVHYAIIATDNDDTTGFACDLTTRFPRTGFFSAAVHAPGAPPSACINDGAEPDDDVASAPTLGTSLLTGRRLCPNDRDLVRLDASVGDESRVAVRWNTLGGQLDARLVDAGGAVVATATGESGAVTLQHTHTNADPVFLDLQAALPGTRLSYTAEITTGELPCEDDAAEPDDAPAEATPIEAGVTRSGTLCPGDRDVFRIDTQPGRTYRVSLAFEHRFGDLDLELLAGDGTTILQRAASTRSLEELEHVATAAGPLFARITGVGTATNGYYLSVTSIEGQSCPRDTMTPNQSPAAAKTLFEGVYENLVACADAPDWYVVDLNGGESLTVLALTDDPGSLELALYGDPTGAPVASASKDAFGFTELDETLARGRYFYRVSTSAGELVYDLLQEVREPAGPCQPDRFDGGGAPPELGDGVVTRLRLCTAGELDRFAVTLAPWQRVTILTSHPEDARTAVTLRDPAGGLVTSGVEVGGGTYVEQVVETGGLYTVEIRAEGGTAPVVYDLAVFRN
jgi:hypothetical protein